MPVIGSTGGTTTVVVSSRPIRDAVVAQNLWMPSCAGTQTGGVTSRIRHRITVDTRDLRLSYGNWQNPEGTATPGDITIKAALEIGGVVHPLFFGGARSVTLPWLGSATTDPLAVDVPKGTFVYSRTYIVAASGFIPNYSTSPGSGSGGQVSGDSADSGTIADSFVFTLGPMNITGTLTETQFARAVWRLGDSIVAGAGESANVELVGAGATQAGGFVSRALNGNFGNLCVAHGSDAAWKFVGDSGHRRLKIAGSAKYAIENFGTNDLSDGRTVAQVRADNITTWRMLAARGVTTYRTTITPVTSSTDTWATSGNQTIGARNPNRILLNTWYRDGAPVDVSTFTAAAVGATGATIARAAVYDATGAIVAASSGASGHPLAGVFETADTVETARDSGLWKSPGYTADGLHPSGAGHAAMAAAINTSLFV